MAMHLFKRFFVLTLPLCFMLAGCGFLPPEVQTDPAKYPATLEKWRASSLVDHFPESIPASAKSVRFSAFPGFLQGGAWIQLRVELPADEIQRIYSEATVRAKQVHDGGRSNRRESSLMSTYFYTADSLPEGQRWVEFPEDYRLFIYFSEPSPEAGPTWDKGQSKGVVVSLQRNEVVFWADHW